METSEIKLRAMALPDMVKMIIVTDNDSLDEANKAKVGCKTVRKEISGKFDPLIKKGNEAVRATRDLKNELLAPVIEAETYVNDQIGGYMTKIRLIREAAERAEQERKEAEEEAEKERDRKAVAAAISGDQEKAKELLTPPAKEETPIPAYVPPERKMEGVHMRTHYDILIVDINLIPNKYIVKTVNMMKLRADVRESKGRIEIPGAKITRKDQVI